MSVSISPVFPVIQAVPADVRALPPPEKVRALSQQARQALHICARKTGIVVGELQKGDNGEPLPFEGHHWSLTHKPAFVGAVLSPRATGIDIEARGDVSAGLLRKTAGKEEWRLTDEDPATLFFRYWTAKEAVLKAVGVGIAGLSACRVTAVTDDHHLRLEYKGMTYLVEHFFFDGHVASVIKDEFQVEWALLL